jgi:AbrB family looped-hinge helix DNA binding protein
LDKIGRVLIPKQVRDSMGLAAGTTFEVVETPLGLELQLPQQEPPELVRKGQFLVAKRRGPTTISDEMIRELRDAGRR